MDKVIDAAGVVAYSEKSVVSRSVLSKKNGSFTLFSFDKGEELSEHSAPFDAVVLVLDGEAQVTLAGKPHRLKAGELLLMPAKTPHAVLAVERFKMALFLLRAEP